MTEHELWRNAVYFDDDPVFLETYGSYEDARQALRRRAQSADLLFSDYYIEEVDDDAE